jgi:beta-galactosidase
MMSTSTPPGSGSLALAFLLLLAVPAGAQGVPDWENPAVFERGQVEAHAPLMPFEGVEEALAGDRKASPWCLLLSGRWRFLWALAPAEAPAAFFEPGFDVSSWGEIEVPGSWQMQGFGHPMFRNIAHPFPSTPPRVPRDYNPVGSYRRSFSLPDTWGGRRILLHFEGVKSASYAWVNGQEVGYNQGGMEPAEYDVTEQLRPGDNTIAVRVYRFSDGTYLEDQDMWRLAGIYRDVYLLAVPPVHVRDVSVTTDLDADHRDAELVIRAEVGHSGTGEGGGYRLRATLFPDDADAPVLEPISSRALSIPAGGTVETRLSAHVPAPRLWSAEHPNLYRLVLELLGPAGDVEETLGLRTGFREVEIRDQALFVNGRPVKLNAVNSHVHHPQTGRTMDVATMRTDLVLMKQFNVNAVRTSHYPPNVEYLDLADELGIYVIDETGDEAHATTYLSERPEWRAAYVDRGRKMVRRDRNHPSIVIWSAGNESGSGENICAVIAEGKRLDPTRPWLYGGNNDYFPSNHPLDCEDIVGPRYPIPFELKTRIGQVPAAVDPRPSFMDEYAAATGNSLGALDEFWEVIRAYPRCIGGAVWDWVSPGILWPWVVTPDSSPHGNHGTLMGRAHLVEGPSGKALALSGHDEWVELYRDPSLDITRDQLTLEMRVFPRAWNGTGPLLTKGDHQYGLQQIDANTLEFFIHDRKRISVTAGTPADWEGSWHHLAGVYDGEGLRLLVDGAVVGSVEHAGSIDHNPFPVNIGRNAALHGQEHAGELSNALVDEVRIFARALEPAELGAHTLELLREARLWLDFEEAEPKGEFYSLGIGGRSYGLVWPDRTVQPELWQLKKSAQAVEVRPVDLAAGLVRVVDHYSFTDLAELDATWQLTADGVVLQEGHLDVEVPPLEGRTIRIPFDPPETEAGARYRLGLIFTLPADTAWAARGHEVAWEQLDLPFAAGEPPTLDLEAMPPLEVEEIEGRMVVRGRGFAYGFDRDAGGLSSITVDGVELLEQGPRANVWRAPLANERDAWGLHRGRLSTHREGMGNDIANGWRSIGLDRLSHVVESVSMRRKGDAEVEVEVRAHASCEEMTAGRFGSGFDLTYVYRVLGSGDIVLHHSITPRGHMPEWLPKVGLQMVLAEGFDDLAWYGRGPVETYPDRRTGGRVGVFRGTVEDQYVPYLVPQDYGNKTDVHWVALTNADGVGLFASGEELPNVSAQHYSTDNLSRAWSRFQLTPQKGVTLNLDHRMSGVGGTAVSVLDAYRTFPQPYDYTVRLRPFRSSEETPQELFRERLP